MLIRILADNPGKTFTRNLDAKFVVTVKELLREGRDMSVQQILRETLDTFEAQKPDDETLTPLREMWKKEQQKYGAKGHNNGVNRHPTGYSQQGVFTMAQPAPRTLHAPPYDPNQQNYFARSHRSRGLPPPSELAARIEEARTSGKLLQQVVQSTPAGEILHNDLIKEFAERCQSASRSVQGYIHAENPAPDDQTLLTLIETNEQLSQAMSKHQRALLQARRVTGATSLSPSPPPGPPPIPPPRRDENRDPFHSSGHDQQWHTQSLPSPLEPNYYGSMAPPGVATEPLGGASNAAPPREQSGAYFPVHNSAPGSGLPQELPVDQPTIHRAAPPEEHDNQLPPAEARQPVTYRY